LLTELLEKPVQSVLCLKLVKEKYYRQLEPVLTRVYKELNLYDKPLQQGMKDLAGKQEKRLR
jgi:hypothetical protein